MTKEALIEEMAKAVNQLPGNAYEFTQPIQMRFNELLAGVRGDIAVKIFGDEFEPMLRAANDVAAVCVACAAPPTSRSSRSAACRYWRSRSTRPRSRGAGLSVSAVQDVIGAAVGGQEAGVIFEGDRSFEIIVRLPESVRADLEALEQSAGGAAEGDAEAPVQSVPLNRVAKFSFAEGPNQISRENGKRRIVVTANVRGRDSALSWRRRSSASRAMCRLPAGYWITWGGQSENLAAAAPAPCHRGAGLLRHDLPAAA